MNVLILSDSHGRPDLIEEAVTRTHPETILFAGDGVRDLKDLTLPCPLYAVRGNCDGMAAMMSDYAEETLLKLGGVRILLMHGHTRGVKHSLTSAVARAQIVGADILVFGHTHEALELSLRPGKDTAGLSVARPLLVCNPGSLGYYPHTFGTLTLRPEGILFSTASLTDAPV